MACRLLGLWAGWRAGGLGSRNRRLTGWLAGWLAGQLLEWEPTPMFGGLAAWFVGLAVRLAGVRGQLPSKQPTNQIAGQPASRPALQFPPAWTECRILVRETVPQRRALRYGLGMRQSQALGNMLWVRGRIRHARNGHQVADSHDQLSVDGRPSDQIRRCLRMFLSGFLCNPDDIWRGPASLRRQGAQRC